MYQTQVLSRTGKSSTYVSLPFSRSIRKCVLLTPIASILPWSSRALSSASSQSSFQLSHRLDGLDKPTVWHEFSPLATEYNAINLGQGFPDWNPPTFAIEAMNQSIDPSFGRNANQYARSYAHMPLAKVLAEDYSERLGRQIDAGTEIATAGKHWSLLYYL